MDPLIGLVIQYVRPQVVENASRMYVNNSMHGDA